METTARNMAAPTDCLLHFLILSMTTPCLSLAGPRKPSTFTYLYDQSLRPSLTPHTHGTHIDNWRSHCEKYGRHVYVITTPLHLIFTNSYLFSGREI